MPAGAVSVSARARRNRRARPRKRALLPSEPTLWAALEPTAKAAFAFWNGFMALRMGMANDKLLDNAAKSQWLCIIRAVSWVESKHGTAGANHPKEDPMQCANPADVWWRELTDQIPQPQQDRIICGPGKPNFFAGQLPPAAAGDALLPAAAKLSSLNNPKSGHKDPKFTNVASIYWAIPFLLHKANRVDGASFKCGDCSRPRLVDGAVAYNGGGDPKYRDKINEALNEMGCISDVIDVAPLSGEIAPESLSGELIAAVVQALREGGLTTKITIRPRDVSKARRARALPADAWTPDEIKKSAEATWDRTDPGTNCATVGGKAPIPKEDCNCYVKNACREFIDNLTFDAPEFDADKIIAELARSGSVWTALGKDPVEAMKQASQGRVVVAGMTSAELGEKHGHLALVIVGKEASGTWKRDFPRCCAGSLNASARVRDRGVHFTFPVKKAPEIRYFSREPNRPMPQALLRVG